MGKKRTSRKLLILLTVFSAASYLFYPAIASAKPDIAFSDTYFDFGQIYQNKKVEHIFTFKNEGDQVLSVDKVKTSCGCTAAVLSNKAVKPGETGEIGVTFNPAHRTGKQKKTIYVNSDDPVEPVVQLTIEASVKVDLEASPDAVYFSQVKTGQSVTKEVALKNTGQETMSILSIDTDKAAISVKMSPKQTKLPVSLKPGASFTITVSTEAPKDSSRVYGRITVKTDSQTTPEVFISVSLTSL